MFLTRSSNSSSSVHAFPTAQLALLACIRVAEPIALCSIFPYAWKLVLSFQTGHHDDASFYAGILISAFSLTESLSGMHWGALSDKYGRRPILLCGCAGTCLSLLIVGFSQSFWVALFGRALGGLLNGNIGVIQTMVGELVKNPDHEPTAYAIMPLMWAVGAALGPMIGGYFSQPCETFPSIFPSDGLFAKFPFLLPNLICSFLLLLAMIIGAIFIEETHPLLQVQTKERPPVYAPEAETPLFNAQASSESCPADLRTDSYGTFNPVKIHPRYSKPVNSLVKARPTILSRRIVMLLVALGLMTFHVMAFDVLFPIFCQDGRVENARDMDALSGGLGFTTQQTGIILGINGIIALVMQAFVFPAMCSWLGVWKVFALVAVGHPIAYFITPCLSLLPLGYVQAGIYVVLTIRQFFQILQYPLLLILLKDACPGPSYLGTLNGLAASVGAACRMLASPAAGYVYAVGSSIGFTPLAWWAAGGFAILGAVQFFFVHRQKDHATVHSLARHISRESLATAAGAGSHRSDQYFVIAETIDEESEPESDTASFTCERVTVLVKV